jgi:hypothetical protein
VVSARDKIHAGPEQLLGSLSSEPKAAGNVLAVDDAAVDAVLIAQERNTTLERVATRRSDDVADYQEVKTI